MRLPDADTMPVPEHEPSRDHDLGSWLSYLYAPLAPYLKRITIVREGLRGVRPQDILVPEGYRVEVVATDLSGPVHCCFDDAGACYVIESGHKVENALPRVIRIDPATGERSTFFEWPRDRWVQTGAITGGAWVAGSLYLMNTDTLWRLTADRTLEEVVGGLPGHGDHQANHPVLGPDGMIYFGVGSVTNMGVVGADNYGYGWLTTFPTAHDVPATELRMAGRNYAFRDVLGSVTDQVESGAFVPFGTRTERDQVVPGDTRASGAILRCRPDGSQLHVVAWGLRNPYGVAFHPDGRLFATEHGSDERGGRYIVGDPDDLYEIRDGAWYGWPDYASGVRLDDPFWGDGGQGREPVIADPPDPEPPVPFVSFTPHAAANGIDFARDDRFGHRGDAFVALFGDVAPITTPRLATPAGFKVVRVEMSTRRVIDFAVNRISGPASKLPHGGFERPSACVFGPDGSLYVVDFGELKIAPEKGGIRTQQRSGTVWRISRTSGPAGDRPPQPIVVPLYALTAAGAVAAGVGVAAAVALLLRLRSRRRRRRGIAGLVDRVRAARR